MTDITNETEEPKAKILLAEDDRMTRLVTASALAKDGYLIVEAENGGVAYDKAITEQPNIILLDVNMPVMDGFEVLKKLRAHPSTAATPVILLTSISPQTGEADGLRLGAEHYVTKPVDPDQVRLVVRVALKGAQKAPSPARESLKVKEKPAQPGELVQPADVVHLKADVINQIVMPEQLAPLKSGRKKDDPVHSEGKEVPVINTGEKLPALEEKMGGGLRLGTLTLAVGAPSSGKSTLSQHLLYGALKGGHGAAYYTSEQSPENLLAQMKSIGLDVSQYYREEKLRIHDVPDQSEGEKAEVLLERLSQSMERLSGEAEFMVVNTITDLAGSCPEQAVIAFFSACHRLAMQGMAILVSVHSYAFGSEMFTRLSTLCDGYLSLGSEEVGGKSLRTLEVKKINSTVKTRDNVVSFVVEPEVGIRFIPMNKANI